ncbi:MAG: tyrosine-type recombinase/integrase [bacterium]
MSLPGQKTKSDYLEWGKAQSLILKLERDGDRNFALLISIGIYTGLRISDILTLRWVDIIGKEFIEITEKKTKKFRKIKINPQLSEIINRSIVAGKITKHDGLIFFNRFGTNAISVQWVNRALKEIAIKYSLGKDLDSFTSHSLRKSFGRRVFENNDNSERSLILLSEMFNHSNIKTTKVYLGIRDKEIYDVYDNL